VCFNLFHVIREVQNIPEDAREARLHLTGDVPLLDHTTGEVLRYYEDEFNSRDDRPNLDVVGLDRMRPLSGCRTGMRLGRFVREVAGAVNGLRVSDGNLVGTVTAGGGARATN
jgi:hypothetical protein